MSVRPELDVRAQATEAAAVLARRWAADPAIVPVTACGSWRDSLVALADRLERNAAEMRASANSRGVADPAVALGAVIDALRVARDLLAADHGKMCQEAVREIDDTLLRPDVRHAVPPHLLTLIEDARGRR